VTGLVLGLLGSGEFQPWAADVDRTLLRRARTGDGRALVLPTASAPEGEAVFARWAAMGIAHYAELGVTAELAPIRTRADADDPGNVARLAGASLVFCSGGNPAYLSATLRDTVFWAALLDGLDRGLAYGGCSAGIQCLGARALDASTDAFGPGAWAPGLGLFPGVWFGPHWNALDRYVPGLSAFIRDSVPDGDQLFAIDEDTAVVGDGHDWEVVGAGDAHVWLDGSWRQHAAGTRFTHELPRS
jgi:cyanophycinase-like exopeptidase